MVFEEEDISRPAWSRREKVEFVDARSGLRSRPASKRSPIMLAWDAIGSLLFPLCNCLSGIESDRGKISSGGYVVKERPLSRVAVVIVVVGKMC